MEVVRPVEVRLVVAELVLIRSIEMRLSVAESTEVEVERLAEVLSAQRPALVEETMR